MIITDGGNDRALIWNGIPTQNFSPASNLIGKPDFESNIRPLINTQGEGRLGDLNNVLMVNFIDDKRVMFGLPDKGLVILPIPR